MIKMVLYGRIHLVGFYQPRFIGAMAWYRAKEYKMNGKRLTFLGMIAGLFMFFGSVGMSSIRNARAGTSNPNQMVNVAATSSPSLVQGAAGDDEIPPASLASGVQSPDLLATAVPGGTLLYFIPTDNDATATILYLYNTNSTAQIVALRGYSYNGVLVYSLNINIGAASFLRLASDSIAAAPPPSWATPAPIITNFTDFTYFASLQLPQGVKVEGYTIYNPGTGVVDPRADQGETPLRFSTDPASIFLPSVQK